MRGAFCVLILTVRTRNVSLCFAVCGATELHCSMLQTFQFATIIINIIINIINIKRHHHRYHIRAIGAADVRGKCVASVWQVCGTNTTWFCCCEDEAQVERTSRCNANYEQFHVCEFV